MEGIMRKKLYGSVFGIGLLVIATSAYGESVEEFYRGKTVTLVASTGAGGPLDLIARTVAKHMARHIPGAPSMIVRNMPGAGHVLATNFMFNQAPKDGTYIATVVNSIPLHQVIDGRGVRYDAQKFNWIGATGVSNLMTVAWSASNIRTIDDAKTKEVPTGATGTGSGTFIYTNATNLVLGTRFKMVLGYASSTDIDLAMERGEIWARGGFSLSGIKQERPEWIKEKKVNVLFQVGSEREKEYPDVPLMHELAQEPDQRQVLTLLSSPVALGRPFFAPPEIPADRLAALRAAFSSTMNDPAFIAEAQRLGMDLNAVDGIKVNKIVEDTIGASPAAIARARSMLQPEGGK
jgi:tripartite-type tricarboxylate transporter receptor subunit TctC